MVPAKGMARGLRMDSPRAIVFRAVCFLAVAAAADAFRSFHGHSRPMPAVSSKDTQCLDAATVATKDAKAPMLETSRSARSELRLSMRSVSSSPSSPCRGDAEDPPYMGSTPHHDEAGFWWIPVAVSK